MYERQIKKVIVDAGHGGEDPGALGNGLKEKDLNLQAANYMYKRLQELGIPVEITRDSDISLPRKERINKVLSLYGRDPNVILVSNHINAGGGEGAEIVYGLRNNSKLASMALDNIGNAGQLKRKIYQRRLPENPNKDYYYIIRETDPLESILVEYGFIDNSRDASKLKNNLNNYVEGVVKAIADYSNIPYSPPNTIIDTIPNNTYIVQRGDTLYSIANKYNTTVSELKRLNNLTSDILSIGQLLIVKEDNEEVDNNYDIYEVVKGDSLWLISKKFNTTVKDLIDMNNLETINLQIGDKLIVPSISTNKYIVKRGDTLWSIAKNNNISVNNLKKANNLTTNLISIGDELIIPK